MDNFLKLPEEYIKKYSDDIKKDLELYGLQINHFGFIGFLLNMMGWGRYDSSQYYEHLFREAFVATSDIDENLTLHGSIFNYQPSFSVPAKAFGFLEFDFDSVTKFPDNAVKREVYFGLDNQLNQFYVEKYPFLIESQYVFYQDRNEVKTIVIGEKGSIQHIPSTINKIKVPLVDTYQYDVFNQEISLSNYSFHSHHSHVVELDKPFLAKLKVEIKQLDKTDFEEFEHHTVKFLSNESSKHVFFKRLSALRFLIEFGNGIRGLWVPNSEAKFTVYQTFGQAGNLVTKQNAYTQDKQEKYNTKSNVNIRMITTYEDYTTQTHFIPSNYVKILFEHSEGGKDTLTGEYLREDTIKHIQSRHNLINQIDFNNLYYRFGIDKDFRFIFKKIKPLDNTFYLYHALRDDYMQIIHTTNHTVNKLLYSYNYQFRVNYELIDDLDSTIIFNPTEPTVFSYKIIATDRYNQTKKSYITFTVPAGIVNKSIRLTWEPQPDNSYYRIFGRQTNNYIHEWETRCALFTDVGNIPFDIILTSSIDDDEISNLSIGTYLYHVSALTETGYSNLSNSRSETITSTNKKIILNWTDVGVTEYRIFRKNPDNTVVYWNVCENYFIDLDRHQVYYQIVDNSKVFNINSITWEDPNGHLEPGEYLYRIASSDRFGRSEVSYVSVVLAAPHNTIKLYWDNVPNAEVYLIYGRTYNRYIYNFESYDTHFIDYGNIQIDLLDVTYNYELHEDSELSGQYFYYIQGLTRNGYTNYTNRQEVLMDDTYNTVKISWDLHNECYRYRVFREDIDGKLVYWDIFESSFNDMGINDNYIDVGTIDQDPIIGDNFIAYPIVYKPRFNIKAINDNQVTNILFNQINTESGILPNGNYIYRMQANIKNGYLKISDNQEVLLSLPNNTINITWKEVVDVEKYMIFREHNGIIHYTETITNSYTDQNNIDKILIDQTNSHDYYNKNILNREVISPFIYKYNEFMKQYDGYFMYENMVKYFNKFQTIDYNYIPPSIHLNIVYYNDINKTVIYLKSHQDITNHDFYITILNKDIDNKLLTPIDQNNHIYILDNILDGNIQIKIEEYYFDIDKNKDFKFIAETDNIQHMVRIKDQLVLFRYILPHKEYIPSIPCMSYEKYSDNPNLYLENIYNMMVSADANLKGNRMQTDHVQFRFLETLYLEKYYTERALKHGFDFYHTYNIMLPLKMSIVIKTDTFLVNQYNINLLDEEKKILLEIAQYLQTTALGVDMQFYRSQIVDLIHENKRDWVKSVEVDLFDSLGHNLNKGLETFHEDDIWENIIDDRPLENWYNLVSVQDRKIKSLKYNPVFWHWDLDNLQIQFKS